jgi:hypothetical protein
VVGVEVGGEMGGGKRGSSEEEEEEERAVEFLFSGFRFFFLFFRSFSSAPLLSVFTRFPIH